MRVTITVPRFVILTETDRADAMGLDLRVTMGPGSLFVEGDLDTAVSYVRRFAGAGEEVF